MIDVGDRIGSVPVTLGKGGQANLSDFTRDFWLVLYFYPKDNTPGCTTEGIDFNALYPKFRKAGAEVMGVSRDSVRSHQNFCAKHGFAFDLVSDADETLCRAFDVIKEKTLYGKKHMGIERSTFVMAPGGRVAAAWRGVRVPGHAFEVLKALQDLQKAPAAK
jgi:peroxiredoxin Q/BCP